MLPACWTVSIDWFDRTADHYRGVIAWALDHRKTVMRLATLAFLAGLAVLLHFKESFFLTYDEGEFQVYLQNRAGCLHRGKPRNRVAAVLAALKDIPEINHTYATIGAGDSGTVRDCRIYVKLKERNERHRSQDEIQRRRAAPMYRRSREFYLSIVEVGQSDGNQKPLIVNIRGDDIDLLEEICRPVERGGRTQIPGIVDLDVTLEQDIPEYRLIVDRERAVDAGVMTADIVRTVGAPGGRPGRDHL